MPSQKFVTYLTAIAPLEAHESMRSAEVVVQPHLKKSEDRKKFWAGKRKVIRNAVEQELASYKDVATKLARVLRG